MLDGGQHILFAANRLAEPTLHRAGRQRPAGGDGDVFFAKNSCQPCGQIAAKAGGQGRAWPDGKIADGGKPGAVQCYAGFVADAEGGDGQRGHSTCFLTFGHDAVLAKAGQRTGRVRGGRNGGRDVHAGLGEAQA
jgi:hypothetical protein